MSSQTFQTEVYDPPKGLEGFGGEEEDSLRANCLTHCLLAYVIFDVCFS